MTAKSFDLFTLNNIVRHAVLFFKIPKKALQGKTRVQEVVYVRMIIAKVLRDRGISSTIIGSILNRDHSTVLHYLENWDYVPEYVQRRKIEFEVYLEYMDDFDKALAHGYLKTQKGWLLNMSQIVSIRKLEEQKTEIRMSNGDVIVENENIDIILSQVYHNKFIKNE